MAKRIVCCPVDSGKFEYLYVDTAGLNVENITDEISAVVADARTRCCFDDLAGYAMGEKVLDEKQQELFSFDFFKLNSFELFKDKDELRLKTGSEKILHSCLLSYYRREYDGTQQHTFFSEPAVSNTYVRGSGGVEHELTLEDREFIKNDVKEETELETLDKGKSDAEREAEAAQAQAELELQEALAKAEEKAAKKEKQEKSRKAQSRRIEEEERYREFRNQDNVQAEEYQRLRRYEEEMRDNNAYLASQYGAGNYSSLPGYIRQETFASLYESETNETLGIAVDNNDLYRLASRMEEFNVPYTVGSETLADGRQVSCLFYSSDFAEPASSARDFFELERNLIFDNVIGNDNYYSAYQLSAFEYADANRIDTSLVLDGSYNANQMFRILDAELNGYDATALANPSYTPAHMDAITYYMGNGWDASAISDPALQPQQVADFLIQEEIKQSVPSTSSFFSNHDYDGFLAYGAGTATSFFNDYDNVQQQRYYKQQEANNRAERSREELETFKENVHNSYEQRQRETNYAPNDSTPLDTSVSTPDTPSNSGYTPNGYTRSDSSFATYDKSNMPFSSPASPSVAGGPNGNKGGGAPVGAPPSYKTAGRNHYPLDDLKVHRDFVRKVGLKIETCGSRCVSTGIGAIQQSFRTVTSNLAQNDETGSVQANNSTRRNIGNVILAAQLVTDLPRQFVRAGHGISYTSNAIANAGRRVTGNDTVQKEFKTTASAKEAANNVRKTQESQFNEIKQKYGATAAKMNIREIDSNIKRLGKEKDKLIAKNKDIKNKIRELQGKKGLSATERKTLKELYEAKRKNEQLIKKKIGNIKDLNGLKTLKNGNKKALKSEKKNLKRLQTKDGRWRRLPGMLVQSFVSQLHKAGNDITIGGMATASSFAMKFVRNPVTRLSAKGVKFVTVKTAKLVNKVAVKPVMKGVKFTGKLVGRPIARVVGKRVLRPINKRVIRPIKNRIVNPIKKGFRKITNSKTFNVFKAVARKGKKGFSITSKIISFPARVLGKIFDAAAALKRMLVKFVAISFCVLFFIMFLVSIFAGISETIGSTIPGALTDSRVDLSRYTKVVNEAQMQFNQELMNVTTSGDYTNVFYDYDGINQNSFPQILAMTYARFGEHIETDDDAVDAYMKQLFADGNFYNITKSELYSCDGCEERQYFCYQELDQFASETRKTLHQASNGVGCIKTETTYCNDKSGKYFHKDGKLMNKTERANCGNWRTFYGEFGGVDGYVCNGHYPDSYRENGCKKHNDGKGMDTPCACDNYKTGTVTVETDTIVYYCPGVYKYVSEQKYEKKFHNDAGQDNSTKQTPMSKPCSCKGVKEGKLKVEVNQYYCQGYCEGHYTYYCNGHTEVYCKGEHQDAILTVTSLDIDGFFRADSSVVKKGSNIRGEAYANTFVATAYCSCNECLGESSQKVTGKSSKTASGTTPKANHTIAVDPNVIPLGTHVWIDGKEYVAEDTRDTIKGNKIAIYFKTHAEAEKWGSRTKIVYKNSVAKTTAPNADAYGFKGWNEDNISLARQFYNTLVSEDADILYAGLDNLVRIMCKTYYSISDIGEIEFGDDTKNLTKKQQKVLEVIYSGAGATSSNKGQAWVADVYHAALGGERQSKCCAKHAGSEWSISVWNWENIQVGATVYGSTTGKYGHVGIYIGNGLVAHNIGYLKIESLRDWVQNYNGQTWGWNGGQNLTGLSQYNDTNKDFYYKFGLTHTDGLTIVTR